MTREEVIAILRSPEGKDETRRVYKLGAAVDYVERTIHSRAVSRFEAEQMINAVARIAEEFFPGSEETFAIIYGRRFQRILNEVFGSAS